MSTKGKTKTPKLERKSKKPLTRYELDLKELNILRKTFSKPEYQDQGFADKNATVEIRAELFTKMLNAISFYESMLNNVNGDLLKMHEQVANFMAVFGQQVAIASDRCLEASTPTTLEGMKAFKEMVDSGKTVHIPNPARPVNNTEKEPSVEEQLEVMQELAKEHGILPLKKESNG